MSGAPQPRPDQDGSAWALPSPTFPIVIGAIVAAIALGFVVPKLRTWLTPAVQTALGGRCPLDVANYDQLVILVTPRAGALDVECVYVSGRGTYVPKKK